MVLLGLISKSSILMTPKLETQHSWLIMSFYYQLDKKLTLCIGAKRVKIANIVNFKMFYVNALILNSKPSIKDSLWDFPCQSFKLCNVKFYALALKLETIHIELIIRLPKNQDWKLPFLLCGKRVKRTNRVNLLVE